MDETITIPTELTRADEFIVGFSALGTLLIGWWLVSVAKIPWFLILFPVVAAVFWMMTTRAATEIRGVGAICVLLRNRLGERSAYGWAQAYWHYVQVVGIPAGRRFCARLLKSIQQRASSFRLRLNVKIR